MVPDIDDDDCMSNEYIRATYDAHGPRAGLIYLKYEETGKLARLLTTKQGTMTYSTLSRIFDISLRPDTIRVNGERFATRPGSLGPEFDLLTPQDIEEGRFLGPDDPAIVTGDPDDYAAIPLQRAMEFLKQLLRSRSSANMPNMGSSCSAAPYRNNSAGAGKKIKVQ